MNLSFLDHQSTKILVDNFSAHWIAIWIIMITLTIGSIKKRSKQESNNFIAITQLKGVAIWLLLTGHLAIHILANKTIFSNGGYWAVIIFLFFSGYALASNYSKNISSQQFWLRRIHKLYPTIWITMAIWIVLELLLNHRLFPATEVVKGFLGFYHNNLDGINPAGWYIAMQLFWYLAFDLVRKMPPKIAIIILFSISTIILTLIWVHPITKQFFIDSKYAFIFPLGVYLGWHQKQVINIFKNSLCSKLWLPAVALLLVFFAFNQPIQNQLRDLIFLDQLSDDLLYLWDNLVAVLLVIGIIPIWMYLKRSKYYSSWLKFLGDNSYAIFLLHLPLMLKYDFVLFHKPFWLFWWIYFECIVLGAVIINASISKLANKIRR